MAGIEVAFAPPDQHWVPVSSRLRTVRRISLLLWVVPLFLIVLAILMSLVSTAIVLAVAAVAVAIVVFGWTAVGRNWRAWGYAERAEDLLVVRGVLVRRLVVVPYGRMQFVDVTAGPLERRFGIATVQLHTAAAATDASIPGLVPDEAARLRDRLAALGEARSAGL
ncbi:MAG: PH domain-containing protein [Sporichthyaceae bacterium]|nr:PH domain-containing protein [Sporichthyaceae bacterium]